MATILAVDDDNLNLELIQRTLEVVGHRVITVGDPLEVEGMLESAPTDAVITDVMMPGITGWELLERLAKNPKTKNIPVIMLSELNEVPHRIRGLRAGARDYLGKPFNRDELIVRVEALLARRDESVAAIQGHLEAYSSAEVIQNIEQNTKTGILEIGNKRGSGRMYVSRGYMVGARFEQLQGEEAAAAMLELKTGTFHFHVTSEDELPQSDHVKNINGLLMDGVWVEDELAMRSKLLPSENNALEVAGPMIEIPDEFAKLPMEKTFRMVRDQPNTTIEDLIGESLASPNRTRLAVAWLVEEGVLVPGQSAADNKSTHAKLSGEMNKALRNFLQEARFRGFSMENLTVNILADAKAVTSMNGVRGSVPGLFKSSNDEGCLRSEREVLVLNHKAGAFSLAFEPKLTGSFLMTLDVHDKPIFLVVWLGADKLAKNYGRLIAALENEAKKGSGLLIVAADPSTRATIEKGLKKTTRWRLFDGLPHDLKNLLDELAKTTAH